MNELQNTFSTDIEITGTEYLQNPKKLLQDTTDFLQLEEIYKFSRSYEEPGFLEGNQKIGQDLAKALWEPLRSFVRFLNTTDAKPLDKNQRIAILNSIFDTNGNSNNSPYFAKIDHVINYALTLEAKFRSKQEFQELKLAYAVSSIEELCVSLKSFMYMILKPNQNYAKASSSPFSALREDWI